MASPQATSSTGEPLKEGTPKCPGPASCTLRYSDKKNNIEKYKVGKPMSKVIDGSNLWELESPGPVVILTRKVQCAKGFITHPMIDKAEWYAKEGWLLQNYIVTAREDKVKLKGNTETHGRLDAQEASEDNNNDEEMQAVDEDYDSEEDEADKEARKQAEALIIDEKITDFAMECDEHKHWFGDYWADYNMSEQGELYSHTRD